MYETTQSDEFESPYEVRFRSRQSLAHPRQFTARERLERNSRYARRPAAANVREGVPRRSNKRFAV